MAGVYRNGSITVEMGNELEIYVDRVIREVLPDTHRELLAIVSELESYAASHWPIKETMSNLEFFMIQKAMHDGKIKLEDIYRSSRGSREKWYSSVKMTVDGLEATVGNRAKYAAFVYEDGTGKKPKRLFKRLLFKRFGAKKQNELWAKIKKELG